MNKTDKYYIGILPELNFRFLFTDCSVTIQEIVQNQSVLYSSADLLARTLIGSFFVAGMVKEDTMVSIQLEGEGPIERVLTYSNRKGQMRGIVKNKEVRAEMEDKTTGIGKGILKVNRWTGSKLVSQSITVMEDEPFEENLLNYIYNSEQLSSYFSIYLNNKETKPILGGFIFQALPDTSEIQKKHLLTGLDKLRLSLDPIFSGNLSDTLNQLETILGTSIRILEEGKPEFHCECSLDKIKNAVKSIGKEEAISVLNEIGKVELTCDFCNTKYSLDTEEVNALF